MTIEEKLWSYHNYWASNYITLAELYKIGGDLKKCHENIVLAIPHLKECTRLSNSMQSK